MGEAKIMSGLSYINIKGAREHNLKNIDVKLPRDQFIVITGLSGSGKSSLAFDTIYAEGQRRYVESLSSYARQFLELSQKPDVDLIEGLSPAISIEQKTTSRNPRSTVGTVTEIYDYLRLLFARVGKPHCYECGKAISQKSRSTIIAEIMDLGSKKRISILSPIVRSKKGEHKGEIEKLRKEGFLRLRVDGEIRLLEEDIELNPKTKHSIDLIIDRVIIEEESRARIADAIELGLKKGQGLLSVIIHEEDGNKEDFYSEHFGCLDCGTSFGPLEPRMFSFNAPQGACPECNGLGIFMHFSEDKIIKNPRLSLNQGAISCYAGNINGYYYQQIIALAESLHAPLNKPWNSIDKKVRDAILYGTEKKHASHKSYEGVINQLKRRYKETDSDMIRHELESYMREDQCPDCLGARVNKSARFIKINEKAIHETVSLSINDSLSFFNSIKLNNKDKTIANPILKEVTSRLSFLQAVGLDYLTLDRTAKTLSGGEAQRIRLATQIGSALVGVLYVLDEPSIGLHQRDNDKLINTLKSLRNLGNTVLVVEHDEDTILASDYVVDMGPGAGHNGGRIIAKGTPQEILHNQKSLTGQYLSGKISIPRPEKRRMKSDKAIKIVGANGHNLKGISVEIPLGVMTAVTGVSGSGKSSLIIDTLYKELAQVFNGASDTPLPVEKILGLQQIDKVIDIDQSPIGRTPRSNPVTYTGTFDAIRTLFSSLPESKIRGFEPGRFSFNVKGGRCETCKGDGVMRIEMNFLPDVYVTCEECLGQRFNKETLEIKYKEKSIADILAMTVDEALGFFQALPQIRKKFVTLAEVGLGYIHLGQQATTLSGGEAQRIKLAKELSKRATGRTLYILDEPTTGLHFHDIKKLLEVLHSLVDQGNSVLVIEHNLEVIKSVDYVIDLGPEGGKGGGEIVAQGTPEEVAQNPSSHTGKYLKNILEKKYSAA